MRRFPPSSETPIFVPKHGITEDFSVITYRHDLALILFWSKCFFATYGTIKVSSI